MPNHATDPRGRKEEHTDAIRLSRCGQQSREAASVHAQSVSPGSPLLSLQRTPVKESSLGWVLCDQRISGGSVQQKTACDLHPWIIKTLLPRQVDDRGVQSRCGPPRPPRELTTRVVPVKLKAAVGNVQQRQGASSARRRQRALQQRSACGC